MTLADLYLGRELYKVKPQQDIYDLEIIGVSYIDYNCGARGGIRVQYKDFHKDCASEVNVVYDNDIEGFRFTDDKIFLEKGAAIQYFYDDAEEAIKQLKTKIDSYAKDKYKKGGKK